MSKWKDAFRRSLDPTFQTEDLFEFGPPASDDDLAALEAAVSAKIPNDLRELLCEFNGIKHKTEWGETYYFDTKEMPNAIEYYRANWWPESKHLVEWSKNIVFMCVRRMATQRCLAWS